MATHFGKLQEFRPESDSIKSYLQRVTLYFEANEIDAKKQVAVLLSSIGAPIYTLLSDLLVPATPGEKSLEAISKALLDHFEPKRSIITERFHFHKRDQTATESIAQYDAALRKLATHCEFKGNLEETLRDRFVCGLRHEAIQRRLLAETTLTYPKALEIARGMESADKDSKSFKKTDTINAIRPRPANSNRQFESCYRCGRSNHSAGQTTNLKRLNVTTVARLDISPPPVALRLHIPKSLKLNQLQDKQKLTSKAKRPIIYKMTHNHLLMKMLTAVKMNLGSIEWTLVLLTPLLFHYL